MGFGLLFIGYVITYILRLGLGDYAFASMLIGCFLMYLGLSELRKYGPAFIYALIADILLILCSFFECLEGIDMILSLDIEVYGAFVSEVFMWIGIALDLVFNIVLLYGIADMARRVDFPQIKGKAYRNMVFVGAFNIFQIVLLLPIESMSEDKSFLMTLLVVFSLFYTLMNAALVFRCYALICPQGDEEMKRKPSRFEFINRMNENADEREQRAAESTIKYLEEKARKKKEEREKRYKSNHVRYHSKKKK